MVRTVRRSIALAVAAVVMLTACTPSGPGSGASPSPTPGATSSAPPAFAGLPPTALASFASFTGVPALDPDAPAFPGPATPTSLDGVAVAEALEDDLAARGVEDTLAGQGFVVVPGDYRMISFVYDENYYAGTPSYVTTDAAYHVWHLVFDKVLRDLEQETLLPELEALVTGLLGAAQAQTAELAGTPLGDAASRVEQLYQVAAATLGLGVELGPLAREEKALIDAHAEAAVSPLLGLEVNYTLFTPRGHYTRTADLTRYFVAMSVLGQLGFCLPKTVSCPAGPEPVHQALLAARPLVADESLTSRWSRIYEPTAFLVGLADDYTPFEVADAASQVAPGWLTDPAALAGEEATAAVVAALTAARPVLINTDRASVRVMGTRFVIDALVLDQLVYDFVGTREEPRSLPSALDVAAVLGSDLAARILDESGAGDYLNYPEQRAALTAAMAQRPTEDWGGTVYDAWLYALQPMFATHGTAYPDYQRGDGWAAKALQSGLGSYAELKHDTILYAKQAFAEMGGDFPEVTARGWVEPDPVAFERLAAAANLMSRGLAERDLLSEAHATLFADLGGLLGFLGAVARDELAGQAPTDAENERIGTIGSELEGFAVRTSDVAEDGSLEGDQDAAVVADIATGLKAEVLEVGTGRFDRLLVLVPGSDDEFQVAVGAVYSFYEFTGESGQRLTDEQWRALLDAGEAPDRPAWQDVLFGG
jgi:hypothetical protein